ncbi:helix-turn-helix domain-containing protein [Enterococcus sp. LJL90]
MDNFLEKYDAIQYKILGYIFYNGGRVTKKAIIDHFDLSRQTLRNRVEELIHFSEKTNKSFEIQKSRNHVALTLKNTESLNTIYKLYSKQSIKTKIIMELYEHGLFYPVDLALKFSISDSSLFRKIKDINEVLMKFNLQIKNGCLEGSEIDRRNFYYQFFLFFEFQNKSFQYESFFDVNRRILQDIEATFNLTLTDYNKKKLLLFFDICFKRLSLDRNNQVSFSEVNFAPKRILNDLEDILERQLRIANFTINQNEAYGVFVFLVANQIVPVTSYFNQEVRDLNLKEENLIFQMNQIFIDSFSELNSDQEMPCDLELYLQQIHLHSLYYAGFLEDTCQSRKLIELEEYPAQLFLVPQKMREELSKRLIEVRDWQYLDCNYNYLFISLLTFGPSQIQVGLYIEEETLIRKKMMNSLKRSLSSLRNVTCEELQLGESYDVIVSNVKISNNQLNRLGKYIYVISDYPNKFDFNEIKNLINHFQQQAVLAVEI